MSESNLRLILDELRCVPKSQRLKIGKNEWYLIGEVTHRAADEIERLYGECRRWKAQNDAHEAVISDLERRRLAVTPDAISCDVLGLLIKERDEYRAKLDKGKGEWPKPEYVPDDMWAGWTLAWLTLDAIVKKVGSKESA